MHLHKTYSSVFLYTLTFIKPFIKLGHLTCASTLYGKTKIKGDLAQKRKKPHRNEKSFLLDAIGRFFVFFPLIRLKFVKDRDVRAAWFVFWRKMTICCCLLQYIYCDTTLKLKLAFC